MSSVEAFRKYQRESAWTWEHQALTRARFCAGHAPTGAMGSIYNKVNPLLRRATPETLPEVLDLHRQAAQL